MTVTVCRYEIMKKIGDGNSAVVHKCRMANTSSEFAMKIIDKGIMKGKVRLFLWISFF